MAIDVQSTRITATGTAVQGRCRLKGLSAVPTGTAGLVTFRDGGASGQVRLVIDTLAAATGTAVPLIPGDGIVFTSDMHVTLSNITAVTIFYG